MYLRNPPHDQPPTRPHQLRSLGSGAQYRGATDEISLRVSLPMNSYITACMSAIRRSRSCACDSSRRARSAASLSVFATAVCSARDDMF